MKGFTLIEIIVYMAVSSILTTSVIFLSMTLFTSLHAIHAKNIQESTALTALKTALQISRDGDTVGGTFSDTFELQYFQSSTDASGLTHIMFDLDELPLSLYLYEPH